MPAPGSGSIVTCTAGSAITCSSVFCTSSGLSAGVMRQLMFAFA
jgi:hypothetical protein